MEGQENRRLSREEMEQYARKLAQLTAQIYAMSPEQRQRHAQKIREVEARLKKLPDWLRAVYKDELAQLVGKTGDAQPAARAQREAPAAPEKPAAAPVPDELQPDEEEDGVQMYEEPEELPAQEEEDTPVKKPARRKKKRRWGCLVLVVLFLAALAAGAALAMWAVNDISGDRGNVSRTKTIEIEQGTYLPGISQQLEDEEIVRSGLLFRLYVQMKGEAGSLQYGAFEVSSAMSYDELIEVLQTPMERESVRVTFPEGITATQFAARMEEGGLCGADEFLDVANNGDFSQFEFWAKRDEDPAQFMACEGYLFPETYDFFVDEDVYSMVERLYSQFNTVYLENDLQGKAEAMGFTLTQYVTLSSLVQEEAGGVEHQADVAAIFMNRMAPDSPVKRLESNTASYIQNDNDNNYLNNTVAKVLGGWENIPEEVVQGYDTYAREGLPVGPISNPGLDALVNTTRYAESQYYGNGYYFFVTDINGNYYFNQTAEAHERQCDELRANGLMAG